MAEAKKTTNSGGTLIADGGNQIIDVTFETPEARTKIDDIVLFSDRLEGNIEPLAFGGPDRQNGKLLFHLLGKSWSHPSSAIELRNRNSGTSNVAFSLGKSSRPKANSRLAKRWSSSRLYPVAGKISNDLRAGQSFTCQVKDISIGGAQLEFSQDPVLFIGQHTQLEIHYPLAQERTHQTIEIVALDNRIDKFIVRVRFTPITSHHINALANHLIRFEFDSQPSRLELELGNTPFPFERIRILIAETAAEQRARIQIQCETIFSARVALSKSQDVIELSDIVESRTWPIADQLSVLVKKLLHDWPTGEKCRQIIVRSDLSDLWFLGFRKNRSANWSMQISREKLSPLQQYQRARYCPVVTEPSLLRSARATTFHLYERLRPRTKKDIVSWDEYGLVYDKLCEANTSYQALLDGYRQWLRSNQNEISTALDIGAGTGNFVAETAIELPNAQIDHIDRDTVMNFFAQEKYAKAGIENVRISTVGAENLSFSENEFDLVTAVHSIYTLSNPEKILSNIFHWLKPGGVFYVVDIGRTIDTQKWFKHIFLDCLRTRGLWTTINDFWEARAAITQNRNIQATQDDGTYWNRSHEEFLQALRKTGFEIASSEVTYRGNSDLAICRKPIKT